jgi:hypothetical protein
VRREAARSHALTFTWTASARQFLDNVAAAHGAAPETATSLRPSGESRKLFSKSEMVPP